MSEHTPEPWEVTGGAIWIPDYNPLGDASQILIAESNEDDARRIVACVNACVGMADPAVSIATLREALERMANGSPKVYGFTTITEAREALRLAGLGDKPASIGDRMARSCESCGVFGKRSAICEACDDYDQWRPAASDGEGEK